MFNKNDFEKLAFPPKTDLSVWINSAEDGVNYLTQMAKSRDIVLHASVGDAYVHSVLTPANNFINADMEKLCDEYINPSATWGIGDSFDSEEDIVLYKPFDDEQSALFGSENLVIIRQFEGVEKESKIEISQRLIHALDLYWVDEHRAYCRLDERGDIQKVICFIDIQDAARGKTETIITADSSQISKYMIVTESLLVAKFEFLRTSKDNFHGWIVQSTLEKPSKDLVYNAASQGSGSYVNGIMLVHPNISKKDLVGQEEKHWVAFKAYDWKHGVEKEISCAPDALASYFDAGSPLPYEVTPAFFRPEVLQKYRSDTDKYTITERSIRSRAGWYLKTYDVNAEGQVHTYLCYLGELPYEEQIYWRSFNEWPKGPIAERAYQTDILGHFYTGDTPVSDSTGITGGDASATVGVIDTTVPTKDDLPSVVVDRQPHQPVDVLIIAALKMEYDAAREAARITDWTSDTVMPSFSFERGTYHSEGGKKLQIAIAHPKDMGPWGSFPIITALTHDLKPKCLAMCGVCAGKPSEVALGDVIISKFTYAYEEGKHTADGFVGDHVQFPILHRWIKAAQELSPEGLPAHTATVSDEHRKVWLLQQCLEFPKDDPCDHPNWKRFFSEKNWKATLEDLEREELISRKPGKIVVAKKGKDYVREYLFVEKDPLRALPFKIKVGPIASGSAVLKDGLIWKELTELGVRSIVGAEMEAAVIGGVAHKFEIHEWVVVKAVMDYAGILKNDRYKPFAAMASAQVLFRFLENQLQPVGD